MKTVLTICAVFAVIGAICFAYSKYASAQIENSKTTEEKAMTDKKSIVIYFSRADENYGVGYVDKGNTQYLSEFIADATGADMFKVEPAVPYAKDYDTAVEEAKERLRTHNAPIAQPAPDISQYDVVYVGSPVYWSLMPEELTTALKELDFNGKEVHIFVTHEGSGLGDIPQQLKEIAKGATFGKPIAIYGHTAKNSQDKINSWLK